MARTWNIGKFGVLVLYIHIFMQWHHVFCPVDTDLHSLIFLINLCLCPRVCATGLTPTVATTVAKKRSYLINCTLSITHEVVYPKKNRLIVRTYTGQDVYWSERLRSGRNVYGCWWKRTRVLVPGHSGLLQQRLTGFALLCSKQKSY